MMSTAAKSCQRAMLDQAGNGFQEGAAGRGQLIRG